MTFIELIIDFFFRLIPQPTLTSDQIKNVKIVAHRGCHEEGFIENTLEAFTWCLENEIWGIELDIHFTSDNIPIIHHDPHCGRLFKRPDLIIARTRFEDIKSEVPDVPSLEEVVRICGKKIHLMIEIKSSLSTDQNQMFCKILSGLYPKTDYHILSLNLVYFKSINFLNYDCFLPVAELNLKEFIEFSIEKKCGGLAGHYLLMTRSRIKLLSLSGINTGVGFIVSKNSLIREIRRNHTWIFTDYVSSTNRWIKQLNCPGGGLHGDPRR